jgi:hypothetical protein
MNERNEAFRKTMSVCCNLPAPEEDRSYGLFVEMPSSSVVLSGNGMSEADRQEFQQRLASVYRFAEKAIKTNLLNQMTPAIASNLYSVMTGEDE